MSIRDLPSPGAYARAWRTVKGLPAGARVKHPDWARGTVTASEMLAEMRRALQRRINIRGGKPQDNDPMPIELVRDSRRLDDILRRRVRVYQFESDECRARFSHLLARMDD